MIRAGRLDRKITIERKTTTTDSIGGVVETWATWKTAWSEVVPVSGREALRFNRPTASRVSKFVIRYLSGLTEKDRIVHDSQNWDVIYIREIGRREGLEVIAEASF